MMPIPVPVRQRIVQLYDRDKSTREIAQYCGFCVATWVEQGLAPVLRAGEMVILDNLAIHKVRGVRETIDARGAGLLYLPALFSGFQSHRTHVEQDQAGPAQPRPSHRRTTPAGS